MNERVAEWLPDWMKAWGLAVVVATPLAFLFGGAYYLGRLIVGEPVTVAQAATSVVDWYLWAFLAPVVIWLSRRFPLTRRRLAPRLLVHGIVGTGVALLELAAFVLIARELFGRGADYPFGAQYAATAGLWIGSSFLCYAVIVAAVHTVDYHRESRKRAVNLERMEKQLARAELQALKMQLHPHFLFNTLNTINVLVSQGEVEKAAAMVTHLGDLLRLTLARAGRHTVSVREELELLGNYLAIEQVRFDERLDVEVEVAPELLDVQVPNMLLQPIVENAMYHGIGKRAESGWIRIAIHEREAAGRLVLRVEDDGPGFASDADSDGGKGPDAALGRRTGGVGLSNTRARLARLYGDDHRLRTGSREGGGAVVEIQIPRSDGCREPEEPEQEGPQRGARPDGFLASGPLRAPRRMPRTRHGGER